jgi:GNAT superfamily N-acetyltransferase
VRLAAVRDILEAADYLRACGAISLLNAVRCRFLLHYRRLLVLELAFEEFVPPPNQARRYLPSLHIGRVSHGHVTEIMDLLRRHRVWRRRRELEEVLQQRSAVLFAADQGQIIAYACASSSIPSTHKFARGVTLDSRCAYGVHAFVATRYRSMGVYPRLVAELVRDLHRQEYVRMRIVCDPRNRVALSSHRRVGMKVVQELRVLNIAGLVRTRLCAIGAHPPDETAS